MNRSRIITGVAACATVALTCLTCMALPAAAQSSDDDGCVITDIGPETTVIGISAKRVQFDVQTDCDDTEDVKWSIAGQLFPGSAHVSWFAACNYDFQEGPAVYDCEHDGSALVDPLVHAPHPGNSMAGENVIYAYAFIDANHNDHDDDVTSCEEECNPPDRDTDTGTITILRRTTFSSTFNTAPEPRRRGQRIDLSADLITANWDTASYTNDTAKIAIQFRATGSRHYRTIKTVTARQGHLATAVTALRSGYWRAVYPGTDQKASSTSNVDYVKVSTGS